MKQSINILESEIKLNFYIWSRGSIIRGWLHSNLPVNILGRTFFIILQSIEKDIKTGDSNSILCSSERQRSIFIEEDWVGDLSWSNLYIGVF